MAANSSGGFRPPAMDNILWKCAYCGAFNKPKADKCKKCGEDKKVDESGNGTVL